MAGEADVIIQTLDWAKRLSDEELKVALEMLREEYRVRLKRSAQVAALKLRLGDDVESVRGGRKLPAGVRGHVTEVRTNGTIVVHFPEHGVWTLDATLVRKIDADSPGSPAST